MLVFYFYLIHRMLYRSLTSVEITTVMLNSLFDIIIVTFSEFFKVFAIGD